MPEKGERSDELKEILGRMPTWPVRWGSLLILLLLLSLFAFTWTVRYPELARGQMLLRKDPPPLRIRAPRSGPVHKIRKEKEGQVLKGEPILFIGKPENLRRVRAWEERLRKLKKALSKDALSAQLPSLQAGKVEKLEKIHRETHQALDAYRRELESRKGAKERARLRDRMELVRKMLQIRRKRRNSSLKSLERARSGMVTARKLLRKGAISEKNFRKRQESLLKSEKEFRASQERFLRQKLQLKELHQEWERTGEKKRQRERRLKKALQRALESFQARIERWKRTHIVKARKKGSISETHSLSEGEWVEAGEEVLAIVPPASEYKARAYIPPQGIEGVKKGTEARLKLHTHPSEEYGVLKGEVKDVAELPSEKGYRIRIGLKNGLRTNSGKRIDPGARAKGSAELITRKRRLLKGIFSP